MLVSGSGPHRQRHFFHLISASQHLTFFRLFLQNLPVLSFLYVYTIIIRKESKATEFGSCDLNHVIQFQCLWKKLTRKWPMQFPKINWLYFQTDIFLLVKENITREKQAKKQFSGARSKMLTFYSQTPDLENMWSGWHKTHRVLQEFGLEEKRKTTHN